MGLMSSEKEAGLRVSGGYDNLATEMEGPMNTIEYTTDISGIDRCHRCGGLMVPEYDSAIGIAERRCVSCGDRVDPVILAHRQGKQMPSDAEQLMN